MLGLQPAPGQIDSPLSAEEQAWLERNAARRARAMAYSQIQGTKPQTLAYGLTDSPVGLAAWILEKFHGWTIPGSTSPPPFPLDRLLTNVMLYWFGGINAANWLYVSLLEGGARQLPPGLRVELPAALLLMPEDLSLPAPRSWAERIYTRLERFNVAPAGGHFPAFQHPDLLIQDVREFFRGKRA